MSLSSYKYSLFFLAIVALAACSGNVQEVNNQNQGVELNQNEQKTLLDEASKDSESDLLESFESLSNIESSLSELTNVAEGDVDNSSLIADKLLDEEPIITFDGGISEIGV